MTNEENYHICVSQFLVRVILASTIMLLQFFFILLVKSVMCSHTTEFEAESVSISSRYCSSGKFGSRDSVKIVCNFRQKAAYLANATHLLDGPKKPNLSNLELEIRNCSRLQISSDFQISWRNLYSSLHLTIDGADLVVQEEILPEKVPFPRYSGLISISMRNVKIDAIFPYLMSNTNILMVNIWNSSIGVVSESTFQNVIRLWQLRICQVNISRLASNSMLEPILVSNAPENIHIQWAPFIFNETHIEHIESDALKFIIPEKSVYFNIIYSNFTNIQRKGIQLFGIGHVLIADSIFNSIEDDALSVRLENAKEIVSVMDYPTLTIMGLEIFDVNVTNFMNSFSVENGKVFLIRVSFRLHGMLQPIMQNFFGPPNSNKSSYVEQIITECSCSELVRLNLTAASEEQGVIGSVPDETISEMIDGEHDPSTSVHFPHFSHNLAELYCHVKESLYHINVMNFHEKYCNAPTTISSLESTSQLDPLLSTPIPINLTDASQSTDSANAVSSGWFFYSSTAAGICGVVSLASAVAVYLYRQKRRRGPYYLRGTKKHQPNRKHVGVISENPICEEEGEDDIQV